MKHFLKIDKNGFLLFGEDLLVPISKDESGNEEYIPVPEGFVDTPLPTNEKDEQIGFYRPKWNGTEWVEGATQEEIDELTKVEPSPPTEIEQLKERLIIAENTILDLILGGL